MEESKGTDSLRSGGPGEESLDHGPSLALLPPALHYVHTYCWEGLASEPSPQMEKVPLGSLDTIQSVGFPKGTVPVGFPMKNGFPT